MEEFEINLTPVKVTTNHTQNSFNKDTTEIEIRGHGYDQRISILGHKSVDDIRHVLHEIADKDGLGRLTGYRFAQELRIYVEKKERQMRERSSSPDRDI